MIAALGLLLAQALVVEPNGEAVGQLFVNACFKGELRLGRDRGQIVPLNKLPAGIRGLAPGGWYGPSSSKLEKLTVVKVTNPAETFVIMASYQVANPNRTNPANSCTVVSRSISFEQAQAVFYRTHPGEKLSTFEWDGPSIQEWDYVAASKGYAFQLKTAEPRWIVLETKSFPPDGKR